MNNQIFYTINIIILGLYSLNLNSNFIINNIFGILSYIIYINAIKIYINYGIQRSLHPEIRYNHIIPLDLNYKEILFIELFYIVFYNIICISLSWLFNNEFQIILLILLLFSSLMLYFTIMIGYNLMYNAYIEALYEFNFNY